MDLTRLKYFCTIVETGSLTQASNLIGISHSGLSKAMSLLQLEFNRELLIPVGRGLEVTDDGYDFYQKATQLIIDIENLKEPKIIHTPKLKIGLSEVLAVGSLDYIINEFKSYKLACQQLRAEDIAEQVLNKNLDFAFGFVPFPKDGIEYLPITKVTFNLFYNSKLINKKQLTTTPTTAPTENFSSNVLKINYRDGWPKSIKRDNCIYLSNFALSLSSMIKGQCTTYVPDFIINKINLENKNNNIKIVPHHFEAETKRDLYLIKLKKAKESDNIKKACRVIRKLVSLQGQSK